MRIMKHKKIVVTETFTNGHTGGEVSYTKTGCSVCGAFDRELQKPRPNPEFEEEITVDSLTPEELRIIKDLRARVK